jgi:hypothetical protein
MSQPIWKYIANLGDANPIEHGGYFIYEDETGVYCPEGELLIHFDEHENDSGEETFHIYRFSLDKCVADVMYPYTLSANKYHPELSAWFAGTEEQRKERPQDTCYFKDMAASAGIDEDELRHMFCSWNTIQRALAWQIVGNHHGFENLDSYPLTLTRKEVEGRYADELKAKL